MVIALQKEAIAGKYQHPSFQAGATTINRTDLKLLTMLGIRKQAVFSCSFFVISTKN